MDPSFRFDPDCSDNEAAAAGRPARGRPTQSAWDFSSYAESVTAEHARRRTTSIDEKISLARKDRRNPVISDDSDADESGGSGEDDSDEDEEALVEGESSGDEEEELEESEDDEEAEMEGSGDEDEVETGGDSQGEDEGEDEEEGGDQEEEDGDEAEGVHEVSFVWFDSRRHSLQ
jgi:ATP-dependent RNA helicase DDX27